MLGFADRPLSVYQGEVTIRGILRLKPEVRPGQSGILRATLTYQACDDQRCLLPVETALSVPITCGTKE